MKKESLNYEIEQNNDTYLIKGLHIDKATQKEYKNIWLMW